MKKIIPLFGIATFLLGVLAGYLFFQNTSIRAAESDWYTTIEHVSPTVVSITGSRVEDSLTTTRTGTGIIITPDGMILTSKHLLWEGFWYIITLSDGSSYPARLLKEHPVKDLVLLQIVSNTKLFLPVWTFIDSQAGIQTGTKVLAIGTMLWLYPWSSIEGIISGLNRTVSFGNTSASWLIQTSIAATLGNSWWPLIQRDGTIIGIMIGIVGGSSQIGWAIPLTQSEIDNFIWS